MTAQRHYLDVLRLAAKALENGAVWRGSATILWDISGSCEAPFTTTYWGRPSKTQYEKWVVIGKVTNQTRFVEIVTKCHKCTTCLKERARLWKARAVQEIKQSERTWFGTLTLSPEAWSLALSRARARASARGVDYASLSEKERFALWDRQIQTEITKWLKRLRMDVIRKAGVEHPVKTPFRYLFVVEKHASGVPHYHVLIHETSPDIPVRKRQLDGQWSLGFTQFKLVEEEFPDWGSDPHHNQSPARAAGYVAKYVGKDMLSRVRASQGYGKARLDVRKISERF